MSALEAVAQLRGAPTPRHAGEPLTPTPSRSVADSQHTRRGTYVVPVQQKKAPPPRSSPPSGPLAQYVQAVQLGAVNTQTDAAFYNYHRLAVREGYRAVAPPPMPAHAHHGTESQKRHPVNDRDGKHNEGTQHATKVVPTRQQQELYLSLGSFSQRVQNLI